MLIVNQPPVRRPLALWIIGPIGAGKSHMLARLAPASWRIVDQDAELERRLEEHGVPLDTRTHDLLQAALFARLRQEVIDHLWQQVIEWRHRGISLAIETTGNKPPLLRAEVAAGSVLGYLNLGVGLCRPLELCLARNRARRRVLADEMVRSTWDDFERFLRDGVYAEIFGAEAFYLDVSGDVAAVQSWLAAWC